MTTDDNENVINLFSENKKSKSASNKSDVKLKYYAGFSYVKVKRDANGNKFRKDYLIDYNSKCHYMVTVMREIDGEVVLYSYDVPTADLFRFMKSFEENTLDGVIISIDKYFPDAIV